MATYIILNLAVCAVVALAIAFKPIRLSRRRLIITILGMLLLTAVFDSLIVGQGIVAYDEARILGIYIGKAPVEDFAYALVAAVAAPYLWNRKAKK